MGGTIRQIFLSTSRRLMQPKALVEGMGYRKRVKTRYILCSFICSMCVKALDVYSRSPKKVLLRQRSCCASVERCVHALIVHAVILQ